MARIYSKRELELVAIADCLKGISRDNLNAAEKEIMEILIKAGIAEYSNVYNTVKLKG